MRFRRSIALLSLASVSFLGGCALFRAAQRPPVDVVVDKSPERVKRGEYLANHVMDCMSCHTPMTEKGLDRSRFGAGGRLFGPEFDLPGSVYSRNITPDPKTGLGGWSDGEIIRAMREGVSKDGTALFPVMPYHNYRHMSDEDAKDIVAYLHNLPPVENKVPERKLDFPLNLIVNTMPQPLEGPVASPANELQSRGKYVFQMSGCAECHTPREKGQPIADKELAGGHKMKIPGFGPKGDGLMVPNITQDQETGIGSWTDQQIKDAVRFGRRPDGKSLAPVMPWPEYNGMKDEELDALVAYLRTIKPISNPVEGRF